MEISIELSRFVTGFSKEELAARGIVVTNTCDIVKTINGKPVEIIEQ